MHRYPEAKRGDRVDVWHGRPIADPYRALEDVTSAQTREWLASQQRLTQEWFAAHGPAGGPDLHVDLPQPAVVGPVASGGARLFFLRPDSAGGHPVLFCREGIDAAARVLVDPNAEGTQIARYAIFPSPSGRYVVYASQKAGEDVSTLRILDVERGQHLTDDIPPTVLPVVAWHPDEKSFYYNALRGIYRQAGTVPEETGLYRHWLGGADELELALPWNGGFTVYPQLTGDGAYLCLHLMNFMTRSNALRVRRIDEPGGYRELIPYGQGFAFIAGNEGSRFLITTTVQCDRGRVVQVDLGDDGNIRSHDIVPESAAVLARTPYPNARMAVSTATHLYVAFLEEGHSTLLRFEKGAGWSATPVELPGFCTINALTLHGDRVLVLAESITFPESVFIVDGTRCVPLHLAELPAEPRCAVSWRVVRAIAADGSVIPASVVMPLDGETGPRPLLLSVYGGLGAPFTPRFKEELWLALRRGYACALAHVRGGGEFGDTWHAASLQGRKQVTFDDCHSVARALAAAGITSPDLLALKGESYGALVAAVAYVQQPDLFGAIIAEVPLVDLLRHLTLPGGGIIERELGDPERNAADLEAILQFAPLQNLSAAPRRPALLVVVGELDARCRPGLAYKFVAQAQHVTRDEQLVLLDVVAGAGHSGWPPAIRQAAAARVVTFIAGVTGR